MATWKEFQFCAREQGFRQFETIGSFWKEYKDMKRGENIELTGNVLDPDGYKGQLSFSHEFMFLIGVEDLLACLGELPPDPLPEPDKDKIREYYDKLWITEEPKLKEKRPDAIWKKESWLDTLGGAPRRFTLEEVKDLSK